MSGTIIPGQTIVAQPTTRQTIPYGDRPIGEIRNGVVYPTRDHYQFLLRLGLGLNTEVENTTTIIENVNSLDVNLGSIEAQIGTIEAELSTLEAQVAHTVPPPLPPPVPPLGPVQYPPPVAPAQGPPPPPTPLDAARPPYVPPNLIGSPMPLPAPVGPIPSQPPPLPPALIPAQAIPPLAAAAPPVIANPGWQVIGKTVLSGSVTSVPFVLPTSYSRFHLTFQGVQVGTSAAFLGLQVSINGGTSYITGSSYAQFGVYNSSASAVTGFAQTGTSALLSTGLEVASAVTCDGDYDIYPGTSAIVFLVQGRSSYDSSAPVWTRADFSGAVAGSGVVNAMQIIPSSGSITAGTFWLFGLQ